MSKWLFALTACLLVIAPAAAQNEWQTVYAQSGLYSVYLPADWVVTFDVDGAAFLGDSIIAAESQAAYEAFQRGESLGAVIQINPLPLATYYLFGERMNDLTDEERVMLPFNQMREMGMGGTDVNLTLIDGFPAAVEQSQTTIGVDDRRVVEQTYVLADGILYGVRLERPFGDTDAPNIAAMLDIYPADAPTERDPLVLDDGAFTLPLEPGWLVLEWGLPSRPFGGTMWQYNDGDTSSPRHYLIVTGEYATTFEQLYRDTTSTDERLPLDLAAPLMLLSAYPYDSQFGTAAYTVTDEDRAGFFDEQTGLFYADYDADALMQIDRLGVTTLSADLTSVFNRENSGVLRVFDTNYHFYTLLIAAPTAGWADAPVESWLAGVAVNPVSSITALDDGIPVGLQVGQRAPNFAMTLLDGSTVMLADFRGKPVVLDFWASWCDPCVVEMPIYRELMAESDEFTVLAVNYAESPEVVSAFVVEHELNFPVALDVTGDINDLFRVRAYPTHLILDADGIIRAVPGFESLTGARVRAWIEGL